MKLNSIADMLVHSARSKDVKLFLAWERGDIPTYECMSQFLKNNKRDILYDYINSDDFTRWLNSLGYRRVNK